MITNRRTKLRHYIMKELILLKDWLKEDNIANIKQYTNLFNYYSLSLDLSSVKEDLNPENPQDLSDLESSSYSSSNLAL